MKPYIQLNNSSNIQFGNSNNQDLYSFARQYLTTLFDREMG